MKDTIFALSTAPGVSALAVIRISGPEAFSSLRKLIKGKMPLVRVATLKKIIWDSEIIDECIVVCFSEGSSFTGEKVVELQVHGSPAITSRLHAILLQKKYFSIRSAEEGEFTRQAFYNNRLDLTQVEGLADLLKAETETQRKFALSSLTGGLSQDINLWKSQLIEILARIEANIDFSDQNIEVNDLVKKVDELLINIKKKEKLYETVKIINTGVEVAIIGPPNVGKSTLLNTLGRRQLAITSDIAGTTRDIIEARVHIKGILVTFMDTAGLRETNDKLEKKGINLVRRRIKNVLARIILIEKNEDIKTIGVKVKANDLIFKAKADQGNKTGYKGLSNKNGSGIDFLLESIEKLLPEVNISDSVLVGERQKTKVKQVSEALYILKRALGDRGELEILAEEARGAIKALDELTGRVDSEEVLGRIFKSFCIGK